MLTYPSQLWHLVILIYSASYVSAFAVPSGAQSVLEFQSFLGVPLPHPPPGKRVSLPVGSPTKSFWVDSPGANPLGTVGSEGRLTKSADVCIVGSGITGVSAAYHFGLAAAGKDPKFNGTIAIFEARGFCSGATGRNGGHLTPSPFWDFAKRTSIYGVDETLKSYDLEEHATRELLGIIHDSEGASEEVDLVQGGHITLFLTPEEEEATRRDYEAAKAAGLGRLDKVVWVDREVMNKTKGTPFPGVWTPGNNLWPLKLVTRLFELASDRVDIALHTHTPVTSVRPSSDSLSERRYSLSTPRGDVGCDYVLHATNGYANHLLDPEQTGVRVVPTRGQIVAVSSTAETAEVGRTGWSANGGFEYWFPRPLKSASEETSSPLIILGGGREVSGPRYEFYETDDGEVNETVGRTLRKFLLRIFPPLFDAVVKPLWEWTGIMGYTSSGNPFVGRLNGSSSQEYLSVGYSGHGMPRAYACAEAVTGMVIADMTGAVWAPPPWFPAYFLLDRQ